MVSHLLPPHYSPMIFSTVLPAPLEAPLRHRPGRHRVAPVSTHSECVKRHALTMHTHVNLRISI